MSKIEIITLKEVEFIQAAGEKKQRIVREKKYHAAITNHSLSIGEKLGLIGSSQLTELVDLSVIESLASDNKIDVETDFQRYLIVIYLSVIGMNRKLKLSFDEFVEQYFEDRTTVKETYRRLILASIEKKPNKFAKGLNTSTKKAGKDQKQIKSPALHIECAEDRYVLYCLVYGMDSEIFWYHPLADVERIIDSKMAYDGWRNNPK